MIEIAFGILILIVTLQQIQIMKNRAIIDYTHDQILEVCDLMEEITERENVFEIRRN